VLTHRIYRVATSHEEKAANFLAFVQVASVLVML
jgi:hypothetical protein